MTDSAARLIAVIKASGAINDPEIVLPSRVFSSSEGDKEIGIVPIVTRVDLSGGRLVLFFKGDRFALFTHDEPLWSVPFYPLLYFLCYRSHINYNIAYPPFGAVFGSESPSDMQPVDRITFSLQKLIRREREEEIGGKTCTLTHFDTESFPFTIMGEELERYLHCFTPSLHLSISYYLIGCENIRYFLVEFYKAIKVIENALGGEAKTLTELKPYGLTSGRYKKFKKDCNDEKNPFDVGRHAPQPGAQIQSIDFRRLLSAPTSKEVWSESVKVTRQTIEAYFAYLCSRGPKPT